MEKEGGLDWNNEILIDESCHWKKKKDSIFRTAHTLDSSSFNERQYIGGQQERSRLAIFYREP